MFEIRFRVDYIDTDMMGIVHHSSYCRWLERARVEWLRFLGQDYFEMERQGYALPLRTLHLEYLKPLRFDDRVKLSLQVQEMGRASVKIAYRLYLEESNLLVSEAFTDHVLVKQMKPVSIPQEWREKWHPQSVQK